MQKANYYTQNYLPPLFYKLLLIPGLLLGLLLFSQPVMSQTCTGGPSVDPVFLPGNPDLCEGGVRIDPPNSDTYTFDDGLKVVVTITGDYLSWTSNYPVDCIVVKGGPDANKYTYDPPSYGDNCLVSPNNSSGNPAAVSHIDFCYTPCPDNPPEIECPEDEYLGCNPSSIPDATKGEATVEDDDCDTYDVVVEQGTPMQDPDAAPCGWKRTDKWTVTDGSDNMDMCTRTYTWTVDTEAPVQENPGDWDAEKDLGCFPAEKNADDVKGYFDAPTFDGGCSDVENVDTYPMTGSVMTDPDDDCKRSIKRTWKVTDCSEKTTMVMQTLTWTVDTDAPVHTNADGWDAEKDLGCFPAEKNADDVKGYFDAPTFDGGCSDVENVDTYPMTGSVMTDPDDDCKRSIKRTWKVTDCSEKTTMVMQTLTWTVDTDAPVHTNADGWDAEKDLGCFPAEKNADDVKGYFDAPTFDGGCSDVENVDTYPMTGSVMTDPDDDCKRSIKRTWKVTDCSEKTTMVMQTLTWTVDTDAPVHTNADGWDAEKDLGCFPAEKTADDVDGYFDTPTFDGGCSDDEAVDGYPKTGSVMTDGCNRSIKRTWKVTDCSGLETEVMQTLTWTVDTDAPVHTNADGWDAEKDLGCFPAEKTADDVDGYFDTPTFDGGCSDDEAVDGYPKTGSVMTDGCNRSIKRTWKVTDCSGLETEVMQTLTWTVDTDAPVHTNADGWDAEKDLGCFPAEKNADDVKGYFDAPTFDGGCSDVENVDTYPMTGSVMTDPDDDCKRSIKRTWKVTDCSEKTTMVMQTLTWTVDTDAPVHTNADGWDAEKDLSCFPAEKNADDVKGYFDAPTFDGGCSDVENVDTYPMTGSVMTDPDDDCKRSIKRTWKVTDCSEKTTMVMQTLTWTVDTDAPVHTNADGWDAEKDLGCRTSDPTSFDFDTPEFDGGCSDVVAVDGYPKTSSVMTDPDDDCIRSIKRTWKVTDCSEKTTMVMQTLTWKVYTPVECSISVDPYNCSGLEVKLVASGAGEGGTYAWSTTQGGTVIGTDQTLTVGAGTYWVTVTDACGCSMDECYYTVEPDCGTAWAWNNQSKCFDDLNGMGCGREADKFQWGFTTEIFQGTIDDVEPTEYYFDVLQGAPGKCGSGSPGTDVGDIKVTWDFGEDPEIEINLDDDYYASDIHIWIGDNPLPKKRGKCVAAPGQFDKLGGCLVSYSPDDDPITISNCSVDGSTAWIAIHVVACTLDECDKDGYSTKKKDVTIAEIVKMESDDLMIYPNPSFNTVNVQFEVMKAQDIEIQIFDFNGRVVQQRIIGAVKGTNSVEFDTQPLQNGVYLMALTSDDGKRKVKKFVKLDR